MIDYHVLGISGAAVSLRFLNCINYNSIELKFVQLLTDINIQMWGVALMRLNLIRALQRRGKASRVGLLKCMLDEVSGDHSQSLKLVTIAQQLVENDETAKKITAELDHNVIIYMVGADTTLGDKVAKKALTYTGYESALLEQKTLFKP